MKIACIGYREWAFRIYEALMQLRGHCFLMIRSRESYNSSMLRDFSPDLALFYGWSWMIEDEVLKSFPCLMLHPSPLPKYRGGSPLQNQILDGVKQSAVTVFRMTQEMDAGDIVGQAPLDLSGSMDDIFQQMTTAGISITTDILSCGLRPQPQVHSDATYCRRRKPSDSEITPEELKTKSAEYLHNKIRMLAKPYPNAYIRTSDNRRLLIKVSEIAED